MQAASILASKGKKKTQKHRLIIAIVIVMVRNSNIWYVYHNVRL